LRCRRSPRFLNTLFLSTTIVVGVFWTVFR
jgi:hypothetical protein